MTVTVSTVNATEAKNRFGDVIRRAYRDREHLIVERGGIPVVAILPISDYEEYLTASRSTVPADVVAALEAPISESKARQRLQEFLVEIHAQMPTVAPDEAEKDILTAVKAVRSPP